VTTVHRPYYHIRFTHTGNIVFRTARINIYLWRAVCIIYSTSSCKWNTYYKSTLVILCIESGSSPRFGDLAIFQINVKYTPDIRYTLDFNYIYNITLSVMAGDNSGLYIIIIISVGCVDRLHRHCNFKYWQRERELPT